MASKRHSQPDVRLARGRASPEARFPAAPGRMTVPQDYAEALTAIKSRIQQERLRVVLSANAAMVLLYWDIGWMILTRQESAGWGAKVIDRLSADLREAFPDMKGFSPRNLKYMRAFAAAWPEREFVQEALAQLPWYHHIALLEKLDDQAERLWYARQSIEQGWSHNVLVLQIQGRAHERQGKALTNFAATLPPGDSDLAAQVFKDPYLFDFLGTAGFVLANGSMSSNTSGEGEIRKAIIEADLVDCMIALPGQLFYSTQIPACLWFLARDKKNGKFRDRREQILFIDARNLGKLVDKTHRELSDEDIARMANAYHAWRGEQNAGDCQDVPGFCKSVNLDEIRKHHHVLTPGRYVGADLQMDDDDETFEEKMLRLMTRLKEEQRECQEIDKTIAASLKELGYA